MAWKQTVIDLLSDGLRFCARGALLLDGILISVFTVWLTARTLWHLVKWLNRVCFSAEW